MFFLNKFLYTSIFISLVFPIFSKTKINSFMFFLNTVVYATQTQPSSFITQKIIKPNGGGEYTAGAHSEIKWLKSNDTTNTLLTFEYNINGETTWNLVASGIADTSDTGSYQWIIPQLDKTSKKCKMRMKRSNTTEVIHTSDNFFTIIVDNSITLLYPDTNNITVTVGSELFIEWVISGSPKIEEVTIELSIDTGKTWILLASKLNSKGPYSIYIPEVVSPKGALIKISDVKNSTKFDITETPFTIVNPFIPIITKKMFFTNSLIPIFENKNQGKNVIIHFSNIHPDRVILTVFSLSGKIIDRIDYGYRMQGSYALSYKHTFLPGLYLFSLSIGHNIFTKKLLITR